MFLGQWVGSGRPVVAVGVYVSPVVGGVFGAFAVGLSGSRWACAVWGGCMIELSSGACGAVFFWCGLVVLAAARALFFLALVLWGAAGHWDVLLCRVAAVPVLLLCGTIYQISFCSSLVAFSCWVWRGYRYCGVCFWRGGGAFSSLVLAAGRWTGSAFLDSLGLRRRRVGLEPCWGISKIRQKWLEIVGDMVCCRYLMLIWAALRLLSGGS